MSPGGSKQNKQGQNSNSHPKTPPKIDKTPKISFRCQGETPRMKPKPLSYTQIFFCQEYLGNQSTVTIYSTKIALSVCPYVRHIFSSLTEKSFWPYRDGGFPGDSQCRCYGTLGYYAGWVGWKGGWQRSWNMVNMVDVTVFGVWGGVGWWSRSLNLPTWLMLHKK